MKEILKRFCPEFLHKKYGDIKFWIRFNCFRKGLISEEFRGLMGYAINWKNPQDLNEKINWMKLYYDTSNWSKLADKYLVREYVKERIGAQYLTSLYGVWENADDIDFDALPERFVLKTNHGAGTVMPVADKSQIDIKQTKKRLNQWLQLKYGYRTIEPHYLKIKPLIIAEEFLDNESDFSSSLVDYKIYCFNGKPFSILVCSDREIGGHVHFSYFDTDWKPRPDVLSDKLKGTHIDFPKPSCLMTMLDCASKLAEGHPQVRVDFYIVDGHPVFGEMTMTSNGGYDSDITREYSIDMGKQILLK